MKTLMFLTLLSAAFMVGCSDDDSSQVKDLRSQLAESKMTAETCHNDYLRVKSELDNATGSAYQPVPEQQKEAAQEPVETVEAYSLVDVRGRPTCRTEDVEQCGRTYSDCDDGFVYGCMKDVRYKVIEVTK